MTQHAASILYIICMLGACHATRRTRGSSRTIDPLKASSSISRTPRFAFVSLDGTPVTNQTISGRMTVVAQVATYDIPSQAQARFLNEVYLRHKPQIHALLLVLDPPSNRPIVEAMVDFLDLKYPVALADSKTMRGRGPFAGLHHVPSVVLLDRHGKEVWRRYGLINAKTLSSVISKHDPRL